MTAPDDDDDRDGAPPEADTVALRALAISSLLRRLDLEQRRASPTEYAALNAWVETNGLDASFGPGAFEVFDSEAGSWKEDDFESVAWASEELVVLLWALNRVEAPSPFERALAPALLALLPSNGSTEPFSLAATLRTLEAAETQLALYETLAMAARTEAWARGVAADPSLATGDEELEEALAAIAEDGFPLEEQTRALGAQGAAVAGLRATSRQLVSNLFSEGSPHRAFAFEPARLEALPDVELAVFLATAQLREAALAWLTEGDDWDFDDE